MKRANCEWFQRIGCLLLLSCLNHPNTLGQEWTGELERIETEATGEEALSYLISLKILENQPEALPYFREKSRLEMRLRKFEDALLTASTWRTNATLLGRLDEAI